MRGCFTTGRRGVTLIEMTIVLALIGLIAGLTFPAMSAGIDSLRLSSAADSLVSFFNEGLNRANRRQQVVEITVSKSERALSLLSAEPGFQKKLELPEGVSIEAIYPQPPVEDNGPRRFLLYPGGAPPRIGIELVNARRARRIVRIDPITGVPNVERVEKR